MKFLQTVLNCLSLLVLLAVILVAVALAPNIQTWVAQDALAKRTDIHGSVDSVSAGFGSIEIGNLHMTCEGAVLTLPLLQAKIPLTASAWNRTVRIRSLVATGWTLDLTHVPELGGRQEQASTDSGTSAEQSAALAIAGILDRWELPCGASVDGVSLEGDVLLAAPPETAPARMHVVITGGGMAAGREGSFAIDIVDSDPRLPADTVAAHGTLTVAMDGPRTIRRIGIKADLSTRGGSLPEIPALATEVSATREADARKYTVSLARAGRHVADAVARLSESDGRVAGTWSVDIKDTDLAPFIPGAPLPSGEAAGDGTFDSDSNFDRVHAAGDMHVVASRLGVLAQSLGTLGTVTLDSQFDMTRSGPSIKFDRLSAALGGARPTVTAKALQSFDVDETNGNLTLRNPDGDWVEASVTRLPLSWVSGLLGRLSFTEGDATGTVAIRPAGGGFTFRPVGSVRATGVTAQFLGRTILLGADVAGSLSATCTPQSWTVECAPLVISRGGGILATVRAKESQPAGDDTPAAVAGTWSADPEAIAAAGAIPGLGWVRGRSASGDFSGTVSSWAELDGSLAVSGITPGTSLSASGHVEVGMDGTVSFQIPVKVSSGSIASDVTAEGTWTGDPAGPGLEAKLTGTTVFLEHLELLAGAIARAEGGSPSTESTTGTDRVPFWGSWSGRVGIDFDKLSALNREFDDATGTFDWDQGAIRFKNGRAVYSHHNLAKLEASISFDPVAEQPYGLSAAADASDIDASRLIPGRQSGGDPMLEGHFSVAATSTGRGGNLRDLAEGAKDVFRLKSSGGIIRILKTSVAEAIPEAPAKVTDTLGKVGSSLGSFFGAEPKSADLGSNPISKNAEAVLDFTYAVAEIGFDEMTVTATVGTDKAIGLTDLSITAPDERLTGSGRISYVEGLPLDERPLSLDLAIGTRGDTGDLLAKAGLLSDDKDDLGYTALVQPVHFGGSLAHIDASRWHDLLVKAATRKPDAATQSQ